MDGGMTGRIFLNNSKQTKTGIKVTCDATCFQMNILFLFLECCCKVKRVFLSVTKLKCCQHNITMRHEVIQKTIPSMLRLSLWDVFDSSLNPPTRWSSSLHNGKQKKGNKEHLNRMCSFIMCVCLCVSYLPSLLTLLSDMTAFTRSGTSDKVLEPSQ